MKEFEFEELQKPKSKQQNILCIDASICGTKGIRDEIHGVLESTEEVFLVTSVTQRELKKLYKRKRGGPEGKDAEYFLEQIESGSEKFKVVTIPEHHKNPDNNIIEYCREHKEEVKLLTADKMMCVMARINGVEVQFFEKDNSAIKTLNYSLWIGGTGGLMIPQSYFHDSRRQMEIISGENHYTTGPYYLRKGDRVLMLTKKDAYYSFLVFEITDLSEFQNCRILYKQRIYYDSIDLNTVQDTLYRNFLSKIIFSKSAVATA